MESLSEIEFRISKQCDELAEIIGSLKTTECPNIVMNNLKCILSLLLNSKEHIELGRITTNPPEFVDVTAEINTSEKDDFEMQPVICETYVDTVSEGDIFNSSCTELETDNDYDLSSVKKEADFMILEGEELENKIRKEEPFSCDVCGRTFARKDNLTRHRLLHSENRPEYSCDICGHTFSQNENLIRHVKQVHYLEESSSKEFPCDLCGKVLKRKEYLRNHKLKLHPKDPSTIQELGELEQKRQAPRNFVCNICMKAFTRKEHMNRHKLNIHNIETG